MDLINNRYRVVKTLEQNYIFTSYVVTDIMRNYEYLSLKVLNIENIPEDFMRRFFDDFIRLKGANNHNLINIFQLSLITSIDGKTLKEKKYFYITEMYDKEISFFDYSSQLTFEEKLNLYAKLLKVINTLHIKDYTYNEIKLNNIYINNKNDLEIKLEDLATVCLESLDSHGENINEVFYASPESNEDFKGSVQADIYSLGMILLKLFDLDTYNINDSGNKVLSTKVSSKEQYGHAESDNLKLLKIAEKMVRKDPEERYTKLNLVIKAINEQFDKEYTLFDKEEIEKLNFDTKLVGREYFLQEVHKEVNKLNTDSKYIKAIGVHSEAGVGKSRLLKELNHKLKLSRVKVFAQLKLSYLDIKNSKIPMGIFKKMVASSDIEILEKYEQELVKIMPELGQNKKIIASNPLAGEKEKYRLINRVAGFISDYAKDNPIVVIIDNIHLIDPFFIELIEYIFQGDFKNLLFIFSYKDGYDDLGNVISMISKIKEKGRYIDLKLNPLNEEETRDMVRSILSIAYYPKQFAKHIYSQTYGNALFIEETLKNLFTQKEIYIDKNSGIWTTDYKIEDIPVPVNLEQAMLNQIKDCSKTTEELLTTISLLNGAIGIETLSKVVNILPKNLNFIIEELVRKGIISQKINDKGFVFDFYNKLLKKLVYDRIPPDSKKLKHELFARILEQESEWNSEYKEELIYHLEKADEKQKLLKYCVENADKFEKLNIREGAIKNLEKALSIFTNEDNDERICALLLRLGNIYRRDGKIDYAFNYYERAVFISDRIKNYKFKVIALVKMAAINFDKNNIDECLRLLVVADESMEKIDYIEGILRINIEKVRVYDLREEYNKAFEVCNESIKICGDKFPKIKGKLLKNLGNLYYNTGKVQQAMESYEESIKCFEEIGYIEGTLDPLNNIGVIYGDYYQNDEKALEYFIKMKNIGDRYSFLESECVALANIGEIYFYRCKYQEARHWFLEALEKAQSLYQETMIFYIYIYLTNISLMLQDYNEAWKVFKLLNDELLDHPEQGRVLNEYYRIVGILFYEFGYVDKAKAFVFNSIRKYGSEESFLKWNTELMSEVIKLRGTKNIEQARDILRNIKSIAEKLENKINKTNMIYNAAFEFYINNYTSLAGELISEYENDLQEDWIKVKEVFIKALFSEDSTRLALLNEALNIAIRIKNKSIQWRICSLLGDYYFERKNYFYSVNYYIEACEIIKILVQSVPEKFKLQFINFNNMKSPFKKLLKVKEYYNKINKKSKEISDNIESLEELNRLLSYEDLQDILTNKKFIRSAQSIHASIYGSNLRNIKDIVKSFCSDPIANLQLIIKYLSRVTIAKRAFIFSEGSKGDSEVMVSSCNEVIDFSNKKIIDKVRMRKETIIINGKASVKHSYNTEDELYKNQSIICMPITLSKNFKNSYMDKRSKNFESSQILGYIYLESDNILNNFNEESYRICKEVLPLAGFIMEQQQLRISSSIDKLTGTFTRKYLEDALYSEISDKENSNNVFTLVMFDIDDFKGVNDKFGHQTGDEVLKKVCEVVLGNIRKTDICGRYGGEEFIIVLPNTDISGGEQLAEKLRTSIEQRDILGDKRKVTVSIGLSSFPQHGTSLYELIEKADQALYVAKEYGRNRYQSWKDEFNGKVKSTNKLTGIIDGNPVQDHRNVSVIVELIELMRKEAQRDRKIYEYLGRLIEVTEAQQGILFITDEDEIQSSYGRKIYEEGWEERITYNKTLLKSVIRQKQGIFTIDWDDMKEFDNITEMPDWKSVIIVPLIVSGKVRGVIYLSVSTRMREFKFGEFNFVSTLAQLAVPIISL